MIKETTLAAGGHVIKQLAVLVSDHTLHRENLCMCQQHPYLSAMVAVSSPVYN